MALADVPLLFILAGLCFYVVLGGADFGAGWWQLTAGQGPDAKAVREHAHRAMGPVWEANHVWLIFVLTVMWTAYPTAFASIASTLSIPLFVAAVGIILRGASYALRAGTATPGEQRRIDTVFATSSLLTPLALGAAVGGVASRRVPVGNAAGDLVTSWLNPTSLAIGVLAVATGSYLAAVFLSGDARRVGEQRLEELFRRRALAAGAVAGALALAALVVLRLDARPLFDRLVLGRGLPALVVSVLAGLGTIELLRRRRYEPARFGAALAVAAIVAGWALAQAPLLLPGLTVAEAAAPRETLVAVIVAVLAGAVILFPALALLFRLVLGGLFDPGREAPAEPAPAGGAGFRSRLLVRAALACLVIGVGLTTVAGSPLAHGAGVAALLLFVALAFPAALPPDVVPAPRARR
jgi:cytochrome d ubiquinol oxidase subunit II